MRGELETEQNCNILTPNSSGYNSISFPFSWAAQPGAWGISLCWDMVLIPASSLQLIEFLSHPGYVILLRPPASCGATIRTQYNPSTIKVIPRIFDRMHLLFTQVHFFFWQLGWGQYVTLWLENWICVTTCSCGGVGKYTHTHTHTYLLKYV